MRLVLCWKGQAFLGSPFLAGAEVTVFQVCMGLDGRRPLPLGWAPYAAQLEERNH